MPSEISILLTAAATIGLIHTVLGPDHYLPFIVMARAGRWSLRKTMLITALCGVGHVLGSVLLGAVGIGLGIAISQLEALETIRGGFAAWVLIAFGLVYTIWGLRWAYRRKPHQHLHVHEDGTYHMHKHVHAKEHAHVHAHEGSARLTPWVLFTIFVLGPCESLIPVLMYPAAKSSLPGLILVVGTFAVATVLTMLTIVGIATVGARRISMKPLERYTHAIAGATICLSGLAIQFLGL
ncbi:MAG: sulfite exporter TauE/SafE family protein [Bacteroidota bacterium]